jgi:hypothetical protein
MESIGVYLLQRHELYEGWGTILAHRDLQIVEKAYIRACLQWAPSDMRVVQIIYSLEKERALTEWEADGDGLLGGEEHV